MENSNKQEAFQPYIPADKIMPELTVRSVVLGIILAVIFAAANAYLGLRVGMTITASIPAAVISMAVFQVLIKKNSILESNMVQTIASAGEAIAAGIIFTIPALFLWAHEGVMEAPSMSTITWVGIIGGILGIIFMIPLRDALIVKEHNILPYPEGTACAQVLLSGEKGSASTAVFQGLIVSSVVKFVVDGIKAFSNSVTLKVTGLKTAFSLSLSPSLIGVGYICGPGVSAKMIAGGLVSWFVLIPAISFFGAESIIAPGTVTIQELYLEGGAQAIWSNYIRYIGSGAVTTAGIISLCKSMPLIVSTFTGAVKTIGKKTEKTTIRTDENLPIAVIGALIIACLAAICLVPSIPVGIGGALAVLIFGFFFATVSSRMVGLVGSSNNPISGMTIATLLVLSVIYLSTGNTGASAMTSVIVIASIICVITAIAGDTSQDLKTGFLLGATPKKQQIGELIGVLAVALSVGGILVLLDQAWGFGSKEIPAPQATLMKLIVEGLMGGTLPWTLVLIGAFLAISVELLGVSSMSVAIGIYLPLETSTTIMLGGVVRLVVDRLTRKKGEKVDQDSGDGILFSSGMIAGEGLVGVLLAVLAVLGIDSKIALSQELISGYLDEILILLLLCGMLAWTAMKKPKAPPADK